ncbi:MarR family winged helix-turn-helix transcriptional regulator [Actinomadura latina]|uniref:MarR family transcriptional regulator n=1 Tax=Actinomadura latina TaxID=163603 RepID=A0A846Z0F2_9ACTN|nr:MarR family transcriptional regulator [Actinomadura latina]NKZ05397.1 MarR family transcriptional regulator [Actinomadura latina]
MEETAAPLPPRLLGITTFVLARVGRAGRARMGRMMAAHGLGLWHFAVLAALDDAGPASQRDLGARLRIDPGDLVEVAGRLADAGLVRRERDPSDRRRYVVELTPEGRAELDEVTRGAAAVDAEFLAPLPEGDRAAFERIVRVLLARHGAETGAGQAEAPAPAGPPGPGTELSARTRTTRTGRAARG